MEIFQAKVDFGPVKKGDPVFVLPEQRMLLATYVGFPFFARPKLLTVEVVGALLNQDANRTDKTNSSFDSPSRKFTEWGEIISDSYICLIDARLLEEKKAKPT